MPSVHLSSELGRSLAPEETVHVLAALRHDPLVWRSLEDHSFLARALEQAGGQVTGWSPGRLGLLALDTSRLPEELRAEPMPAPPQALHEQALLAYQHVQRTGAAPTTLREAALLAVALRERRRLTGGWNGLLQELLPKVSQADHAFAIWRTPLACLYDLVPDPHDLLRALLPKANASHQMLAQRAVYEWIVLTRLAQPASTEEQTQVFLHLLNDLPVAQQISLLRMMSLHGSEDLAAHCAGRLLVGHPAFANLRTLASPGDPDLASLGPRALALQQMGTFYQLAGDSTQAFALLNAAGSVLNQWLAGLYLQRLDAQIGAKGGETLVLMKSEQMAHLASAAGWLKDDLGVVLISHPLAGSVMAQPELAQSETDQIEHAPDGGEASGHHELAAFLQLKRARLMFEREPGLARDLAHQSAVSLLASVDTQDPILPFRGEFVYHWQPQDAVQILLELDLPDEALTLAGAFLRLRPNDLTLLRLVSKIQESLGRLDLAIHAAGELVALEPHAPAWRRLSGSLYSEAGDWEQALNCWRAVLELANPLLVSDRLACARAALRAGESAESVEISQAVLDQDPNHGPALALLGQALLAQDKVDEAAGRLVRATRLAPELLEAWLALAQAQHAQGEPYRALETLRAAVAAVPDAAEAHLALGQASLNAGLPAEALPSLKKAFNLAAPELNQHVPAANGSLMVTDQAALLYGRTLRLLGHAGEARSVLERARASWTTCPELALEYAQALLDLGDVADALPVFEMALRSGLPILDGYLLYARVLMGEYNRHADNLDLPEGPVAAAHLEQAEAAVSRILEMDPGNLEARFLMADLLREKGDLQEAMDIYTELAEQPGAHELHWRIQWGLGCTALRLDQNDIALAAFKEACQSKPNSLSLQRRLAEASLRACLPQEALEAAASALALAPDDVENLAWYADFVNSFGETRKNGRWGSVEALQRAVQIDPHRADLQVNLANAQLSRGDLSAARASLDRVVAMAEAQDPAQTGEAAVKQSVSAKDLRRAAQAYLRLDDEPGTDTFAVALNCFERAIALETPPPDLLLEVAQLHERRGSLEKALDLSHQALTDSPESLPVYLTQADLLSRLNRPQAALALLERALRVAQVNGEDVKSLPAERQSILVEIHDRFTRLMAQEANFPAALHHAERALALRPSQARLCCQAANLALSLLQTERAARTVYSFLPAAGPGQTGLLLQGQDGLDLLSLKIEIGLSGEVADQELRASCGTLADIGRWIASGLAHSSSDPRLLAARARWLWRQGDLAEAHQAFESARSRVIDLGGQPAPETAKQELSYGLWLADAALELERWNEALDLFTRCTAVNPAEARAHLGLARALTLAAERQRLCSALGCETNAPGPGALEETRQQAFEDAVTAAGRLVNAAAVTRWQARGSAAFAPTAQAARTLAASAVDADDTAALVALLRQLNKPSAAVQAAQSHSEDPAVLLQLALCALDDPNCDSMAAVAQAVTANCQNGESYPAHALAQAALARAAEQAGDLITALDSYEAALAVWPNEAQWHDSAADLCARLGRGPAAAAHLRQALTLKPASAGLAYKLGRACLQSADLDGAIEYLEQSAELDETRPELWLDLAAAYNASGRQSQALTAAKKASELCPASARGLLLAGEAALSMHQPAQALEMAQSAVRREPDNPAAVLFLCRVLVLGGSAEAALAVIEAASPAVKQVFDVAMERARLVRRLHGPQAALEVLERIAREYPEDEIAVGQSGLLGFLARTQAECGELAAAERSAVKALHLDPDQPDLILMLGRLQRKNGQLDQAVQLLADAIQMQPDNLESYLELGSVYQERREIDLALEVYRQAIQVAPDDHQAFYQCGLILRDSKDYAGAEDMLRRAAELAPNNLSIRRQLVGVIALNLVHSKKEISTP